MPALSFGDNSNLSSVDDARLSRVEGALPTSRQGGVLYSRSSQTVPASSSVLSSGKISPTDGIAATGNTFPFVVQGLFAFSWDGGLLTIYWDGTNGSIPFVIRRADGTQITIPKGSISISALAGNTAYSFAPFVSVAQPERVSFVVGNAGAPRYGFGPDATQGMLGQASQTQRLTTNERLTDGLISYTTGASTTSTAGAGTGTYTGSVNNGNFDPNSGI